MRMDYYPEVIGLGLKKDTAKHEALSKAISKKIKEETNPFFLYPLKRAAKMLETL
jgi:hypothetical protein